MMLSDMVRFIELALLKLRMELINSSYEYYNVYSVVIWLYCGLLMCGHTHIHTQGEGAGERFQTISTWNVHTGFSLTALCCFTP